MRSYARLARPASSTTKRSFSKENPHRIEVHRRRFHERISVGLTPARVLGWAVVAYQEPHCSVYRPLHQRIQSRLWKRIVCGHDRRPGHHSPATPRGGSEGATGWIQLELGRMQPPKAPSGTDSIGVRGPPGAGPSCRTVWLGGGRHGGGWN